MCNLLRCLKGKLERFRSGGPPRLDRLCGGHPVKGVIDLDAIQVARIKLEELLLGKTFRIEDWTPFFIAETGRTEPNRRHWGIIAQVVNETPVNIGQLRQGSQKKRKNGAFLMVSASLFNSDAGDHIRCNLL